MKAAIYTAYHKTSPLVESASVRPIHVGRAKAKAPLRDMIGDDTGDSISDANARYCELTALYWAWKNDREATHIGLMHYRRFLDFAGKHPAKAAEKALGEFRIAAYAAQTEGWLKANPGIDLVLPRPHVMPVSVRENYATRHSPADLAFVEQVIRRDHPGYIPYFESVMAGREVLLGNMFLARREIADAWCAFLFDVLDKLDQADLSRKYYSSYQSRYLGFMSERLFTVFAAKYQAEHPGASVHRVNILNLSQATCYPYIADDSLNGPEHVNIAFSSDDAYLPHAAAMLASALPHFAADRIYNLFYLYSDVLPQRMEVFASIFRSYPQIRFHPLNVGDPFKGSYRSKTRAPSNATYNRFLLFELLPTLTRLLYIDCDMIVNGDLAEIFDTEMGDKKIAAVPDFIMTRTLTNKVETLDPAVPDLYVYHRDKLGLNDEQIFSYFNAGLLLFNFAAMDVPATGRELMAKAKSSRFLFRDQDLLNSYFKDSYLRLPAKYNVFNSHAMAYSKVPAANQAEAMAAKAEPFIIHYAAAYYKPWEIAEVEYSDEYWAALQKTPFFMTVLAEARRTGGDNGVFSKGFWINRARALAARFPGLRPVMHRVYRAFSSKWR